VTNDLRPVVEAVAGGTREPVGWFRYQVNEDLWTWSAELYQIYGFEPGEIVPTTAVITSHKHPDDRVHTDEVLASALATGQPFCCCQRIVTARQKIRTVVTIGRGYLDDSGSVSEVHGYLVDITGVATHASRQELQDAVEKSAATRADIEQAKGALMVVQGVSADDAFAVLAWHSSHANVKLRELAVMITREISHPLAGTESAAGRISRLLAGLVQGQPNGAVRRRSPGTSHGGVAHR
jgi:hypothetical protein